MTESETQTKQEEENDVSDDGVLMDNGEAVLGISNTVQDVKPQSDAKKKLSQNKDIKKKSELADGVVEALQEILGIVYLPEVPDATSVPDPVIRAERTNALKSMLSEEGLYDGGGINDDDTRKKLEEARETYMKRYMELAEQLGSPQKTRKVLGQQREFDLAGGGKLVVRDRSNATQTRRFVGVVGKKITPELAKTLVRAAKMANLEPVKLHGGRKGEKEMVWLAAMEEGMQVKGFTPSEKFLKENSIDKFGNKTTVEPAAEIPKELAAPETTGQELVAQTPETPDQFFDRVGGDIDMPDIRVLDALEKARTEKQKKSLVKIETVAKQNKIALLDSLHDGLSNKDVIGEKEIKKIKEAYDAGAYSQAAVMAMGMNVQAGVVSKDGQRIEKDITAQSELISKKPLSENTATVSEPTEAPKAKVNFAPRLPAPSPSTSS